ncbi:PREDICTED: twinkle protein, mitochondrial-like [Amphimedon queenslandica]|uniref:SF4 helicase domain-containing protein n=1 Tax=Amphimedon queenslandica TaxID=400682 RepID=A0A1X7V6F9_AMPQE|nr:PREDICTED: twinkle protein, mitochondrial-like [Amphimedon queenslandica]|eukprot:XP_003385622.1 PREDICTED: twinkle protein, mitochondrial-like [Amphimedon queenslandica]
MATGLFLSRFFVSYFSSASHSIRAELEKRGLKFTTGVTSLKVSPCPHCTAQSSTLFIQPDGKWVCTPCKKSGTKKDLFSSEVKGQAKETALKNRPTNATIKANGPLKMAKNIKLGSISPTLTPKGLKFNGTSKDPVMMTADTNDDDDVLSSTSTLPSPLKSQKESIVSLPINDKVKKLFAIEKLSTDVIQRYSVTLHLDNEKSSLIFPWYSYSLLSNFNRTGSIENGEMVLTPSDGELPLNRSVFGWHDIKRTGTKELIVTDAEIDAMAAFQGSTLDSIAMNLKPFSALPPQLLKDLEEMDKIFIWPRDSSSSLVSGLPRLLNKPVCWTINEFTQDGKRLSPLDALNNGLSFRTIIDSAKPASHKEILYFHQLENNVYEEFLNTEKVAGVKWKRFSKLTAILKGFRPGELTIFTGPTGSGKTTFMSEMSLDLCQQGVSTLWGSFELSNVRLIKTMMKQFSGVNFDDHLNEYQSYAEKFRTLPMHFMKFHGQTELTKVIEAMTHGVMVNGIQHIIIDNLQFMIGMKSKCFEDSFHAQNAVFAEFRHFATEHNVHITVIIHPRKEDPDRPLKTSSFFGTAKATQEADNILILQSIGRDKFLQITKNRFSGNLGNIKMLFDTNSLTYSGMFKKVATSPVVGDISKSSFVKKQEEPLAHNVVNNHVKLPTGIMKPTPFKPIIINKY